MERTKSKAESALGAALFLLVATAFLITTFMSASDTVDFLRTSVIVPGRVIALNHGGSHPQISFKTKTGESISYAQGGLIFDMKIGDQVQVRYLPENPGTARLNLFGAIWAWEIISGLIGSVALIAGLNCLWKLRRNLSGEK